MAPRSAGLAVEEALWVLSQVCELGGVLKGGRWYLGHVLLKHWFWAGTRLRLFWPET